MPALLAAVFLVVPILEIYVLIQVGHVIGALPTVALLVLDALLGAALFRLEGRRAWAALRRALAQGSLPGRELTDGALVVLGGALLVSPGFVTDVFGVLCLLPPTRALIRRYLTATVLRRLLGVRPPAGGRRPSGSVIDGSVVDRGGTVDGEGPGRQRP